MSSGNRSVDAAQSDLYTHLRASFKKIYLTWSDRGTMNAQLMQTFQEVYRVRCDSTTSLAEVNTLTGLRDGTPKLGFWYRRLQLESATTN